MKTFLLASTVYLGLTVTSPSTTAHGQTDSRYKGELTLDTASKQYVYKKACTDYLVVSGKPDLVYKYPVKDTTAEWLYEILIEDSIRSDLDFYKCKRIFVLVNNNEISYMNSPAIFLLQDLYAETEKGTKYLHYFSLNGFIRHDPKEVKIIKGNCFDLIFSGTGYSKKSQQDKDVIDKFEKIIKRKKC